MSNVKKILCVKNLRTPEGEGTGIVAERSDEYGSKWIIRQLGSVSGDRFGKEARVIDGEGGILVPALWDLYGYPDRQRTLGSLKEETGAAARSGYGWVIEFDPPATGSAKDSYLRRASGAHCNLIPLEVLPELPDGISDAAERGVLALSDGGRPISEHALLRDMMHAAARKDVLLMLSPICPGWDGLLHEGRAAKYYRVSGIPDAAEEIAVARLLVLARESGCRLHVPCISTAGALRQIRAAKKEGLPITCGVTQFHFACDAEDLFLSGTAGKMLPPLTDRANAQALIEGIADGTVDCISSGHVPCRAWEKQRPMESAAFGASGYATVLGVCISRLVDRGVIDLGRLIRLLTSSPAAIVGKRSELLVGEAAEFAIIQPQKSWVVGEESTPAAQITPLTGQTLRGVVSHSFVCGEWY